jgi:class 3 adenylate cyclase
MNRPWFAHAIGVSEASMKQDPIDKWIGEENAIFLNDIKSVYKTSQPVYSAEYELKSERGSTFINYNIVPLMGGVDNTGRGVVLVLEDISSEKRAINTLGRYMSPALVKQIMSEGGSQLGGVRKKVCVLFSDIRSFTTLSESMQPGEVVKLLNSHFEDAVDAILSEQGILDKYIGDACMAVFGVPFESIEDSIHGCNAALKMRDAVEQKNKARIAAGGRAIKIGIGINTGEALSGNIGSPKRMEFSCIGDSVNLASRIEGLTKFFGVTILITEYTKRDIGDNFIVREVDKVVVMGKSRGVAIYELLGRKGIDKLDEKKEKTMRLYQDGLHLYRERRFEEAEKRFALAHELSDDGPSKVLCERCHQYALNPPPEDWSGVFTSDSK